MCFLTHCDTTTCALIYNTIKIYFFSLSPNLQRNEKNKHYQRKSFDIKQRPI